MNKTEQYVSRFNPPIPEGFKALKPNFDNNVDEKAVWGSVDGWRHGLVIQDANGNQFVWVAIPSGKLERVEYNKDRRIKDCDDVTIPGLSESVAKYGGLYIGRYMASGEGGCLAIRQHKEPLIVRYSIAEEKASNMYTSTSFKTFLPTGATWDSVLEFINDYREDKSMLYEASWGNYNDTNIEVSKINKKARAFKYDEWLPFDKDSFHSRLLTTGASEQFKKKNIYDIAGNYFEWTQEKYIEYRIGRGGSYRSSASDYPVSRRNGNALAYSLAFRLALFVLQN